MEDQFQLSEEPISKASVRQWPLCTEQAWLDADKQYSSLRFWEEGKKTSYHSDVWVWGLRFALIFEVWLAGLLGIFFFVWFLGFF